MKLIIMGIFMTAFNINSYANEAFEIEVSKEYRASWLFCTIYDVNSSIYEATLKANNECAPAHAILVKEVLHQCDFAQIVKEHYIGLFQCEETINSENI